MGDGLPARHGPDDGRRSTRRRSTRRSSWAASRSLLWHWRDRWRPGTLIAIYLIGAGLERFLVEFIRRNTGEALGLTQPQLGRRSAIDRSPAAAWLHRAAPPGAPVAARPRGRAPPSMRIASRRRHGGSPPPTSIPRGTREIDGGRLSIGGCDAQRARARVRHAAVRRRRGRSAGPRAGVHARRWARHEVVFASKAFPCTAVLRVFHEEGLSGRRRLRRRARAGANGRASTGARIILHGNAKSEAELRAATDAGARIVIDNFDELDKLERIAAPREVMIRVTPGVVADTHAAILTGHAGSKFGFSLAQAPERDRAAAARRGRTCAACTCTSARSCSTSRRGARRSRRSRTLGDFAAYDLGGGLAVAYTPTAGRRRVAEYVEHDDRHRRRAARPRQGSSRSSPAARSSPPPA